MAETEVEGSDLGAVIGAELRTAQTFDQSKRALAIEYMRGEMSDLPARPNGSRQTSRDVADTIHWILPGIIRVYTASDQMVQFEATQEGGEESAEEASEYTNYSFFRENDGYRILYNATYDSLLMGNGAACSYWSPPVAETKLFRNKLPEEIAQLLSDGWHGAGVEPKPGGSRSVEQPDPMTGEMVEVESPTFTVKLQKTTRRGQIRDMTLKPENLLLNDTATTIDDARMVGYLHDDITRSEALEMADEYGWDKTVIDGLPRYVLIDNLVDQARRRELVADRTSPLRSGDTLGLHEVYIRADKDGDGIAELLQAWYAGAPGSGVLLGSDDWDDDVPFTDIPCYPVPHRWEAESVFDREADIQRVKTTLLRQALENTYAVNMPMREVEVGTVDNPDILANPKFGGIIWRKKGAVTPIVPHVIPYIADKAFAAMEYQDKITAKRTGVSAATMALDPETLQNQTATGTQLQHDAGYSQIELIARNMAELGWSKFFAKRRNLAKKYIEGRIKIPSRNGDMPPVDPTQPVTPDAPKPKASGYRTIQPEEWSDDMACTINVGLGTGSRDRDMSMLGTIMNGQIGMADRLGQAGFTDKAIEFIAKIRKTAVEMAESSGLRNPDDYYPAITDEEIAAMQKQAAQGPAPDPRIAADLQLTNMKMEGEAATQASNAQVAQIKATAETQKAAYEGQISALKLAAAQRDAAEKDEIATLKAALDKAKADNQNSTTIRVKAMEIQGTLEAQRIAAGHDIETLTFSKYLDSLIGIQEHEQAKELLALQPKPEPAQPGPSG